ncbi:MAG: histidine kinase [Acidobacteria bacterium]|nr:histidine kinase [Acidobacteriota bacterium]
MPLHGALSPAFAGLLGFKIHEVLFVLSHYDSFILAEDGQLDDRVLSGFLDLNLRILPSVTQVESGAEALDRLARAPDRFQLVIGSPDLGDMDIGTFAHRLRHAGQETPVTLFGYDTRTVREYLTRHGGHDLEKPFVWQGDVGIFLAIVKQLEDRRNAPQDTADLGVPAILLIEDSIRYYSSFLPVVYQAVFEQTRKLVPEGLSLTEKFHRIKRRPKILLCDRYEEAWDSFTAYRDQILGVISDVEFPREGRPDSQAGERFVAEMRKVRPDIPAILHSRRPENEALARSVGADFLLKGSRDLLRRIRQLMRDRFHFGDFVFRMPDGTEVGRAADLDSFERALPGVAHEAILESARKNEISHWLMARGELELAARLRDVRISDYGPGDHIGRDVAKRLAKRRQERSRSVVADFPREHFDPSASFLRIGSGSVGGKARGLAFTNSVLARSGIHERHPNTIIAVPQAVVLATGIFDRFMEENDLLSFALEVSSEAELRERFDRARFPEEAWWDLRRFQEEVRYPLAVRSSSLLEDSPYQPFSGVYETVLVANQEETARERLDALARAIKQVYASLFLPRVRSFLDSTPYRQEEEKMAVILQRVVGLPHGRRFYPDIAGTARSQNFYPTAPLRAEDGIATVGLGLGEQITSGGPAVRFSPRHPQHRLGHQSAQDAWRNSQNEFLAVDLEGGSPGGGKGLPPLLTGSLADAEADGVLGLLASTWSKDSGALYDGISRPGSRLLTLAPLLKMPDVFPLADILTELLEMGEEACRAPVELEFAANLSVPRGGPREFGFVQLRRLQQTREPPPAEEVAVASGEGVLCRSSQVLGHGQIEGLRDLVVVHRDTYDRLKSREVARDVAQLNSRLQQQKRPYVLIGVGRWGSRDRFLGIPVTWEQVNGAQVIVEAGFRDLIVTPSQGTHFFDNLVSHGIGYFTVNPERGDGVLDWDWLATQPSVWESGPVRHLRFETPLRVRMQGSRGDGWILKESPAKAGG